MACHEELMWLFNRHKQITKWHC